MLVDRLYLFPGGAESRPIFAVANANANVATATVSAIWRNDQPLPFLAIAIGVLIVPGAAQYALNASLLLRDKDSTTNYTLAGTQYTSTVAAISTRFGAQFNGLIIPPGWRIIGSSVCNAGANANSVTVELTGFYIPRGTIGMP